MENKTKKCPYCAEEINIDAIKCKHCEQNIKIEVQNTKEKIKKCPYCVEEIDINAIKCKHCGNNLKKMENDLLEKIKERVWMIVGVIIIGLFIFWGLSYYQNSRRKNLFEEKSVIIVNQLLHKDRIYGITCKKVVLEEEISENFYKAKAYFSNGKIVEITVNGVRRYFSKGLNLYNDDNEHWEIQVAIPNQ